MKRKSHIVRIVLAAGFWLSSAPTHAQWPGLLDESTNLQTSSFTFGSPEPAGTGTSNGNYYDGDFADFNDDGFPDRALNSRYGLLLNTGGGSMIAAGAASGLGLGFDGIEYDSTQWADIDNDGDLDNIMGDYGNTGFIFQFNRKGRFQTAQNFGLNALSIINFDLEGDGDVDIVGAADNGDWGFRIFENNGSGTFTEIRGSVALDARGFVGFANKQITNLIAGDLDGDRDFDLIIASDENGDNVTPKKLYVAKNNGSGFFTVSSFTFANGFTDYSMLFAFEQGLNLGDIDNDGDLDCVFGFTRGDTLHPLVGDAIFINNGSGTFVEDSAARWNLNGFTPGANYPGGILGSDNAKLVDIDYDGDLDWVGFQYYHTTRNFYVFLNNGAGVFTYSSAHSRQIPTGGSALGADLDVTDLNRDGTYDLWLGQAGDAVRILLNRHQDPSGVPANQPRNLQVVSATGSGISLRWQHPPFADSARRYKVYRSLSPRMHERNRRLIKHVAVSRHTDERFSAPITRFTTTAYLNDPDVTLDGPGNSVTFIDRTALPGITYYYAVSHVGAENSESVQTPEISATIAPSGGGDTTAPTLEIISPATDDWSSNPRIVISYADGSSGINLSSLRVSFNRSLGGRAAGADLTDIFFRKDGNSYIAVIEAPLTLTPLNSVATLSATIADNAGNSTTQTRAFVPSVTAANAPTASFTATPSSGASPLAVAFNASASSDSDGKIMRWEWYFGDGSTGLGRQVNYTYTQGGTYTATLLVRDNQGGIGRTTRTITVTGQGDTTPPAAPGNFGVNP